MILNSFSMILELLVESKSMEIETITYLILTPCFLRLA
jgi:hypothetical protein